MRPDVYGAQLSAPYIVATGLLLFVAVAAWSNAARFVSNAYEDTLFSLHPTAGRAFAYGERHFNARNPAEYDISRAEHFFNEAYRLDPRFHYLNHELARVYFLRGDFSRAMSYIDAQISLEGASTPNSYYVRALIEGYRGDYPASAKDYAHFLQFDPNDWAALNDYAWVLLKANRPRDALGATLRGLGLFPGNAWLLNSSSVALYELGYLKDAHSQATLAARAAQEITEKDWLRAYPGNDPEIAGEGIAAFRKAASDNMHRIELALASSTVQ